MILHTIRPVLPELLLGVMLCVNVLLGAFCSERVVYGCMQLSLLAAWLLGLSLVPGDTPVFLFDRMFVWDHLSYLLTGCLLPLMIMVLWCSVPYVKCKQIAMKNYWLLATVSVLGMMVVITSHHFLSLFMGVELMSLPIYALVALERGNGVCSEAAIKYFVIGALATGIFLYGVSLIYGGTGVMDFSMLAQHLHGSATDKASIVVFGMVLVVVAIAFKFGAAPFHMWVPDVYAGSPNAVTLLIATGSKLAAFAMAIRLLVEAMPALFAQWQLLLMVIAILSMVVGNFVAIMQTNLRRLLAYSSIAHMGYMLLGFVSGLPVGYAASCFYQITYVFSALGAFAVLTVLGRRDEPIEAIADLRGLHHRQPWLALVLLLLLFSMAGIPPLVGFWAKLTVLQSLVEAHMVWLAALALVLAIVGVFYYIRVIKVLYFEEAVEGAPVFELAGGERVACAISALSVFCLGLFPGTLMQLCRHVF